MSSTYTTNMNLRKPEHRDPETLETWDAVINANMDIVDEAFGLRQYVEQNYIANADSHCQSLNKLDMGLKDVADLAPTANQKAALVGEGTPSASNKFVTKSYARPEQKVVLFPEFAGATFAEASGGLNTGELITDSELQGNSRFNFYEWLSAEVVLNNYDILVQWKVPATFLNWTTTANKALVIDLKTDSTDILLNKASIQLQKDGSAPTSTLSDKVGTVGGAWNAERLGNEVIYFDQSNAILSSLTAGDTLNIKITLNSKSSSKIRIGAISLRYIG